LVHTTAPAHLRLVQEGTVRPAAQLLEPTPSGVQEIEEYTLQPRPLRRLGDAHVGFDENIGHPLVFPS
jgi:hypothetical protein